MWKYTVKVKLWKSNYDPYELGGVLKLSRVALGRTLVGCILAVEWSWNMTGRQAGGCRESLSRCMSGPILGTCYVMEAPISMPLCQLSEAGRRTGSGTEWDGSSEWQGQKRRGLPSLAPGLPGHFPGLCFPPLPTFPSLLCHPCSHQPFLVKHSSSSKPPQHPHPLPTVWGV